MNRAKLKIDDFNVLCTEHPCHLSWAPVGQAMVSSNKSSLWMEDTLDVFYKLDNLFGNMSQTITRSFSMYAPYNERPDILFHDVTQRLRNVPEFKDTDKMELHYEDVLKEIPVCQFQSSASTVAPSICIAMLLTLYFFA